MEVNSVSLEKVNSVSWALLGRIFIKEVKENKFFASEVFYHISFVNNILAKGYLHILESNKFYFEKNKADNNYKAVERILEYAKSIEKEKYLIQIYTGKLKEKDKNKYLNLEKLFFKEDFDAMDNTLINFCLKSLNFKDDYVKYMELYLGVFVEIETHEDITENLVVIRNLTKHGVKETTLQKFNFEKFIKFIGMVLPDKIFNEFKDKLVNIYTDHKDKFAIKDLFKQTLNKKKAKIKALYEKKYSSENLRKEKKELNDKIKKVNELKRKKLFYDSDEHNKNINLFDSVKKQLVEIFPNNTNYDRMKNKNNKEEIKGKVFPTPKWFNVKMLQSEHYNNKYREQLNKYYLSLEKNRNKTELDTIIKDTIIHKYNNHKFRNDYFLMGEKFIEKFESFMYRMINIKLNKNAIEDYKRMFYLMKKIDGYVFKYLNTYKDFLPDDSLETSDMGEKTFKSDTKLRKMFDCLSHGGNFFNIINREFSLDDFFECLRDFFVKIAVKYNADYNENSMRGDSFYYKNGKVNSKVLFADFKDSLMGFLQTAKYVNVFNIEGGEKNKDGLCAGTLEKAKKIKGFLRKEKKTEKGNLNYIAIKYETNKLIDYVYEKLILVKM
jgi:hypothetical protein